MNKILLLLVSFLLVANISYSAPTNAISTPNTFSPNTVIQSADVNADFSHHQSQYNTHNHTDITQLGTVTTGGWNGTAITTQYGGTGRDLSGAATGTIIVFNGSTTSSIPAPSANGQVLTTKSTGTAPEWRTLASGARNAITRGFEVVVEQPNAARCIVNAGTLYHNQTEVDTTTGTILTLATASNWSSGSTVTITNNWNYIGSSATGQIAYLGTLAPNRLDASGNQATGSVVNLYSYDGNDYWRVVGAVRENGSSQIQQHFQSKDTIMWNEPVTITTVLSAGAWSGAVSCLGGMPVISTSGIFAMYAEDSAGGQHRMWIRPNGSTWNTTDADGIGSTSTSGSGTSGQRICFTDSSQQIQHNEYVTDDITRVTIEGYNLSIR